jgi:uncharacterized membrane protein (DUF106 family)
LEFIGILEDIGDFLPDLVRRYAPSNPPFSSLFIMFVGICLSTTIALISRQLIDLDKLKKYTREQKEYRKLQWKVQQTADRKLKLELDRKSRRMKRINSELSNMRMRPMLIYMIPLMLIFFSLSSFYSSNGHTEKYYMSADNTSIVGGIITDGEYKDTHYSPYIKSHDKKETEVQTLEFREENDTLDIRVLFDNLIDYPQYKIQLQINETQGNENFYVSYKADLENKWIPIAQILNGTSIIANLTHYYNQTLIKGLISDRVGHIAFQLNKPSNPTTNLTLRIEDTDQNTISGTDALIKIDSIELRAHKDNRAAVIPYKLEMPFLLSKTFFGEDYETSGGTYTSLHFVWWYFAVNISIGGIVQKVAGLQPE